MTGDDFKGLRVRLGWTQKDTAASLGVSIQQISAIENGRSRVTPTMAILFRLLGDLQDARNSQP